MKILHVLYQSVPNISGSSIRSRNIVIAQKNLGLAPYVLTSPFQPAETVNKRVECIEKVIYIRTGDGVSQKMEIGKASFIKRVLKIFYLLSFIADVFLVIGRTKPDVVHAHGNFFTGLVCLIVCKLKNYPLVYEVRSDWINNSNFRASKVLKATLSAFEVFVCKHTDALVVISDGLYKLYGHLNDKSVVVGNAILKSDIKCANELVTITRLPLSYGYIGSLIELEGLDYVIDVFATRKHCSFFIAGTGPKELMLRRKVSSLGLKNVVFVGVLSGKEKDDFYHSIDVIINYRRNEPVAEFVTPLKPLEAMSYGKLCVVSDVGGMRELISDGYNGLVVNPDSVSDLGSLIDELNMGKYDLDSIVRNATKYLIESRTWEENARKYRDLYCSLT